jgi:hypothetical protein
MKEAYLNQRVQASVTELFQLQREEEESHRLSIAELVREGARIMLETALEVELKAPGISQRDQRAKRQDPRWGDHDSKTQGSRH